MDDDKPKTHVELFVASEVICKQFMEYYYRVSQDFQWILKQPEQTFSNVALINFFVVFRELKAWGLQSDSHERWLRKNVELHGRFLYLEVLVWFHSRSRTEWVAFKAKSRFDALKSTIWQLLVKWSFNSLTRMYNLDQLYSILLDENTNCLICVMLSKVRIPITLADQS